jgi:hypothetical protein
MVQSQPRQIVHTHKKMELQNRAGGVVQRKDLKPHAPLVVYHRISSKAAPVETKEGKLHAGHRAWGTTGRKSPLDVLERNLTPSERCKQSSFEF